MNPNGFYNEDGFCEYDRYDVSELQDEIQDRRAWASRYFVLSFVVIPLEIWAFVTQRWTGLLGFVFLGIIAILIGGHNQQHAEHAQDHLDQRSQR